MPCLVTSPNLHGGFEFKLQEIIKITERRFKTNVPLTLNSLYDFQSKQLKDRHLMIMSSEESPVAAPAAFDV